MRSEFVLFFCWLAGVFLLAVFGWGLIILGGYAARSFHVNLVGTLIASGLVSFVLLFLLERNLWLSRFMGLRLGPHSTQLKETLFFFFLCVPGLLLRSSDKPVPAAARPLDNDGMREIVETVVFVVVLVLLLKTFLVEAFVIPTGSMADTLFGYHREISCDKCGYKFVVNCSTEAEPGAGKESERVVGGICPVCRAANWIK